MRFFAEGQALFPRNTGVEVFLRRCEQSDLIRLPAGTRHRFNNTEGWVAKCTGRDISRSFPGFD